MSRVHVRSNRIINGGKVNNKAIWVLNNCEGIIIERNKIRGFNENIKSDNNLVQSKKVIIK